MAEFKSFYKKVDNRKFNTWCKHTTRLDTYGCGCQHDCSYCYSKSLLSFRGLWNNKKPSIADIGKICKCVNLSITGEVLRLGGMTDCFQPLEVKECVTYKTIKILNLYKVHYLVVTKSDLVASDKYLEIYDKDLAHFQITITSTDDRKARIYEKAPPVSSRIKAIEKLYKLGFDVSLRVSPLIEKNVDFCAINDIGCGKVLVEFLKVNHWIKKWFNIDYSDYHVKYGGYEHLNLNKKVSQVKKINNFNEISVGEYVKEHHEYFSKNVNHNKNDCCNLRIKD